MLEWFWYIRNMCSCCVLGISLLCEPLTCYLRKFETIYINVYRIFMLDVVYIYYRNVLAMSWSSNLDTLFNNIKFKHLFFRSRKNVSPMLLRCSVNTWHARDIKLHFYSSLRCCGNIRCYLGYLKMKNSEINFKSFTFLFYF